MSAPIVIDGPCLAGNRLAIQPLLSRIATEQAGTIRAFGDQPVTGWICAITNHEVHGSVRGAVETAVSFLHAFARMSPAMRSALVLGWWRTRGVLFVDVGIVVSERLHASVLKRVFLQMSVVRLVNGSLTEELT